MGSGNKQECDKGVDASGGYEFGILRKVRGPYYAMKRF